MATVYYITEPSATAQGHIGLVIDTDTHKVLSRTPVAYIDEALAITAARRMWQLEHAQEVA